MLYDIKVCMVGGTARWFLRSKQTPSLRIPGFLTFETQTGDVVMLNADHVEAVEIEEHKAENNDT